MIYTELLHVVRTARMGSPSRKLVLMVLAEHCGLDAHGNWSCYPSQELIAVQVELSDRQVRTILKDFETEGLLERTPRVRERGAGRGRTSDRITLRLEAIASLRGPAVSSGRSHDQPEVESRPTGSPESTNRKSDVDQPEVQTSRELREQSAGTEEPSSASPSGSARGSRIPDPFNVSPAMLAWAAANVPCVNVHAETEKFEDYWRGVAGARGRKVDWIGTWRNWMRTAGERLPGAKADATQAHQQQPTGRVQL